MKRKKRTNTILQFFLCCWVLTGCVAERIPATFKNFEASDLNEKLSGTDYTPKIDNFVIIMDTSSTMNNLYFYEVFDSTTTPTLFEVEKELLNRLNKTIPTLSLNAGIRTFGFGWCQSWRFSLERLKLGPYDKKSFSDAINSIECASGGSPLDFAIDQVAFDLESATGNMAIIIISDGDLDDDAAVSIIELKKLYKDRICVHTISLAQNSRNRLGMRRLSSFSRCGYTTTAEELATGPGMAKFVEIVFLKNKSK